MVEGQRRRLVAERHELDTRLAALAGERDRRVADLQAAESEIAKLEAVLPLVRERAAAIGELVAQGYAPRLRHLELLQAQVETEQGIVTQRARRDEAKRAAVVAAQRRRQFLDEAEVLGLADVEIDVDDVLVLLGRILGVADGAVGPTHREMGTVGGNLCLDTRCIHYNQSEWWRESNDFCLKYQGEGCRVVPSSDRCHAMFSGDLAPAMTHRAVISG